MRTLGLALMFATSIASADAYTPPTVDLSLRYDGQGGTTTAAADPGGAQGSQLLEMVSGAVTVRDYGTGQLIRTESADAFWSAAGITGTPAAIAQHVIFDPRSQRWYATAEQATSGAPNQIYVASTQTYDLASGWKAIALPTQAASLTRTRLAVDAAGLYITADSAGGSVLLALPLQDLQWTGSGSPTAMHLNTFAVPNAGLVPAIEPGAEIIADARMFIARGVLDTGHTAIDVYRLNWQGGVLGSQTMALLGAPTAVDLGQMFATPSRPALQPAPAPGLDAGTGAIASASAFGARVVGVATVEVSGQLATLWFELWTDPSTSSYLPSLTQLGVIFGGGDQLAPAIAIDAIGAIGIVVVRTSATEFPSIYVTGHGAGDVPGTMRELVQARAGQAAYRCAPTEAGSPFGHYSSLAAAGTGFWALAQYGASSVDCTFGTAWVEFAVPPSDPPWEGYPTDPADDVPRPYGGGDGRAYGCSGCSSHEGGLPLAAAVVALALMRRPRRRAGT